MEKIDNKYEVGDWLIYPKHGLGKAIDYEVQTILKKKTEFLVVFFEQERMTSVSYTHLTLPTKA